MLYQRDWCVLAKLTLSKLKPQLELGLLCEGLKDMMRLECSRNADAKPLLTDYCNVSTRTL